MSKLQIARLTIQYKFNGIEIWWFGMCTYKRKHLLKGKNCFQIIYSIQYCNFYKILEWIHILIIFHLGFIGFPHSVIIIYLVHKLVFIHQVDLIGSNFLSFEVVYFIEIIQQLHWECCYSWYNLERKFIFISHHCLFPYIYISLIIVNVSFFIT